MKQIPLTLPQILAGILASLVVCSFESIAQTPTPGASANQQAQGSPTPEKIDSEKNQKRVLIDPQDQAVNLLSKAVDEKDVRWLEADGEKFLALWEPDKTGSPLGAVLIFSGNSHPVDSPYELNALRNNLSHHGWATLVIHLPPAAEKTIPARPASTINPVPTAAPSPSAMGNGATDNNSNNVTSSKKNSGEDEKQVNQEQTKKDPEMLSDARAKAAMNFLNQQGQYNIVIAGLGIGAIRAARFITSLPKSTQKASRQGKPSRSLRALVMIEARNTIPNTDSNIADYFDDTELPVLDLYYGDHYLDEIESELRLQFKRDAKLKNYYQIQINRPSTRGDKADNRLTQRVRGFLNKHAKGVELKNR